jgi:hypothetical protein
MKLESSRQIFEESSNIKFIQISSVGAELFPTDGYTDGHEETNGGFSQFCKLKTCVFNTFVNYCLQNRVSHIRVI